MKETHCGLHPLLHTLLGLNLVQNLMSCQGGVVRENKQALPTLQKHISWCEVVDPVGIFRGLWGDMQL